MRGPKALILAIVAVLLSGSVATAWEFPRYYHPQQAVTRDQACDESHGFQIAMYSEENLAPPWVGIDGSHQKLVLCAAESDLCDAPLWTIGFAIACSGIFPLQQSWSDRARSFHVSYISGSYNSGGSYCLFLYDHVNFTGPFIKLTGAATWYTMGTWNWRVSSVRRRQCDNPF